MPAKGNTFCNDIMKLILNGTAIANIADNAAASPLTNVYVALHTADPGAGGSQTTSEAAYTSYSRVAVARSGAGWTVTGQSASPAADIIFPTATGGNETETYFTIGTASSGAGKILYRGTMAPSVAVVSGVTPRVTAASVVTEQ